ncbi:translocation/assembly module TamB domain-containing protein [Anaeromyxobacter terrae]|uniref:translocation/assembly module TamB domain-containing protein n=1 Tax=Anaeromyxobacter terrae TaxID=2925406 RepID=UPI001F56FA8F|nr:translocation/assembly module TamB domain-containing protein [Anaeromyxobacter sp. SG22]
MRALATALRLAGLGLLVLAATVGVLLSAITLFATSSFGRPIVARTLIGLVDDALAGRFELAALVVRADGAVEIRGLRVLDPDGHLVLAVDRARVAVDVTQLRRGSVGLAVELDGPSVLLEQEEDGGLSLARAFAPAHPGPPRPAEPPRETAGGGRGLTVRVTSLAVRRGDVWWVDASGATRLEARDLDLDARGAWGPADAELELRLRGALDLPIAAPLSLEAVAAKHGDRVRAPLLRAELGGTALSLVGDVDVATLAGRLAITRLDVARAQARALLPQVGGGADLAVTVYAESDGAHATAAAHVEPGAAAAEGSPARGGPGRADAAVALRLAGQRALGFVVAADRLDPAGLHAAAPPGEVTLSGRGAISGSSLADLRADAVVSIARSRLRMGELGPAEIVARAEEGAYDVRRLTLRAPGLAVDGALRWRPGGAVSGKLAADAADLGRATRNLGALLGEKLPAVSGRARVEAALSGTERAPALRATGDAPALRVGDLALRGVRLEADASGPLRRPVVRLDGAVAAVRSGSDDVAHGVALSARLENEDVVVSGSASLPAVGNQPISLDAHGTLGPRRDRLALSRLALAYPAVRWALAHPATVRFAGPAVDRLELVSGEQRLAVEGGLGPRGALDARAELARVDLARLPPGVIPRGLGVAGVLTADARATGTTRRPVVDARLELSGGAVRGLSGLDASGTASWDGKGRRAALSLAVQRAAGGLVDVTADLPLPLARSPGARLSARVRVEALPVAPLLAAAGAASPLEGIVALDVTVEGTAGAPRLTAQASLDGGSYGEVGPFALALTLENPGERAALHASATYDGTPALVVDAAAPLDLWELVARPSGAVAGLRRAPVEVSAVVPGLQLAALAGVLGLPEELEGTLEARAAIAGTADAPRGNVTVGLAHAVIAGYREVGAGVGIALDPARVGVTGQVTLGEDQLLKLEGAIAAPVERLLAAERLRSTPLKLDAVVPRVQLARAAGADAAVPLAGVVEGRLSLAGTLAAPVVRVDLGGSGIAVDGRPLGEVSVRASHERARTEAQVAIRAVAGGAVEVTGVLDAPLGLGAGGPPLRSAPLDARLVSTGLDLGVLPALLPGVVRSASGKLTADVTARGPLGRPRPRGKVLLADGRVAIAEYGEWTSVALDLEVNDDALELRRLSAQRGRGRLELTGFAHGLASPSSPVEAHLRTESLTITRAGQELANLDLRADATGTYTADALRLEVKVPGATVRLPSRTPRSLQPLEQRPDIVVGKRAIRERRKRAAIAAEGGPGAPARPQAKPFTLAAHVVAPGQLFVKSDSPLENVELKADMTYELVGGSDYASGEISVVHGFVEPIGGRHFDITRGRVQFTGGPPMAAMLDVEATYDNPEAIVTVVVAGPLSAPEIRLSSKPPMDEGQIAMLIATGRTEMKRGSGQVGALTGEEAGKAALGAVATQAFKNLVANKLPLDTVALDSGALRAGRYVTDKVYIGYVRRFDANVERGENENEMRVEYRISPRWTAEGRYGTSGSGGASLVWSKDY